MLADNRDRLVLNPFIELATEPFISYITDKYPSLMEIPEEEFSQFLGHVDTFLVVENLFGGFLTPQRIYLEQSMFDDQLFVYLKHRGYKIILTPLHYDDPSDRYCIELLSKDV